jgi:hypothetical protein
MLNRIISLVRVELLYVSALTVLVRVGLYVSAPDILVRVEL